MGGGQNNAIYLFIYLHIMAGDRSPSVNCFFFFFFFFYIHSRICKTLLSRSAVRHRESLGYVSFFPLMSLGLNPSCPSADLLPDMLIVSYANKETIRLLIISLHSSNRTGSSYTVIWNCLLVFFDRAVILIYLFSIDQASLSLSRSALPLHLLSVR